MEDDKEKKSVSTATVTIGVIDENTEVVEDEDGRKTYITRSKGSERESD